MTKAVIDDSDGVYRIMLSGHALGNQDVCAAISCLACTMAGYLDQHEDERDFVDLQEGRAEFVFRDKGLFEVISTGLLMLEEYYPAQIFVQKGADEDIAFRGI